MANPSKTGLDHIEKVERQAQALRMRRAGKTVKEISQHFGVGTTTIYKYIQTALKETIREPAEEIIALELLRLDAMFDGVFSDAKTGDVKAIGAALRIMERRAKYLGLDKMTQPDVSQDAVLALADLMSAIRNVPPDPNMEATMREQFGPET